jgi:hypothetical protein
MADLISQEYPYHFPMEKGNPFRGISPGGGKKIREDMSSNGLTNPVTSHTNLSIGIENIKAGVVGR